MRRSRVRIIAATNRDLKKLIQEGRFREDLYYRLNVFNIHIPPLRERKEDIPALVDYCLKKICLRMGKCLEGVTPGALQTLRSYSWPGNVRELENVVERAAILRSGDRISERELPADLKAVRVSGAAESGNGSLAALEQAHILKILEQTGGNKTRSAAILGISKKTLYHKLEKYGIRG